MNLASKITMLTKQDIDKLADLARLGLTDEEKAGLEKDLGSILGYVSELEKAQVSFSDQIVFSHQSVNSMRADSMPHESHAFTEALLTQAPKRQGDYLAVKAIIEK